MNKNQSNQLVNLPQGQDSQEETHRSDDPNFEYLEHGEALYMNGELKRGDKEINHKQDENEDDQKIKSEKSEDDEKREKKKKKFQKDGDIECKKGSEDNIEYLSFSSNAQNQIDEVPKEVKEDSNLEIKVESRSFKSQSPEGIKGQEKLKEDKTQDFYDDQILEEVLDVHKELMKIMEKYNIDEDDKEYFLEYFEKREISECVLMATKKKDQEALKLDLEEIDTKLNSKTTQIILQQKIKECLIQAKVYDEDLEQFIEQIKNGNSEEVVKKVKISKREGLKKRLNQLLENSGSKKMEQNEPKKRENSRQTIFINYNGILRQMQFSTSEELKKRLEEEFSLKDYHKVDIVLDGKQQVNNEEFFAKEISGKMLGIIPKRKTFFIFNGSVREIWLSNNSNSDAIKQQILQSVKMTDPHISDISQEFVMGKQKIHEIENLEQDEIKYGQIKEIKVDNIVNIIVHYNGKTQPFKVKSSDTIYDLKIQISKIYLPVEAQSIFYEDTESILLKNEQNGKKICDIIGSRDAWNIQLKDTHTVEFYGFHENREQKYDLFSEFFVENQEKIQQVISNSDFHNMALESLFFDIFIKYTFSGIKKRFPIQITIDKFKESVVSIKSQNLWMPFEEDKPITMNESFVEMYLLCNSDEKLRITLMKLLADLMPLPMYFKKFANILNVTNQFQKNSELCWVLKKGITILSLGLNSDNNSQKREKGKSILLNHLFFTNFTKSEDKHKICQSIPYISIGVYQELFPLNIIDIPEDCSEEITKQLISCSDLLILHSWKSKEETQKYRKSISDKYKIKTIVLMRDVKILGQDCLKSLKSKNEENKDNIQLSNLENFDKSKSIIDILREYFNSILRKFSEKKEPNEKFNKIMGFSKEEKLEKVNYKIQSLVQKQNSELLKFLKMRSDLQSSPLQEKLGREKLEKLVENGLNQEIVSLIKQIAAQNFTIEVTLDLFREKIRQFQSKKTSKFMKIYKLKQQILALEEQTNEKECRQRILEIHNQLLKLPEIYHPELYIVHKKLEEISVLFDEITSQFENKIRPTIFSIELFWREIFSYLQMSKEIGSQQVYEEIFDIVTTLKSKEIMNNQPFQIIDGDSLKMPKQIMQQVFKPLPDQCLVVTILGPQSSGKSTLLNFLFGCDFATSEGRCTRGVYGTFFRVKDSKIENFDGIFVIDTQGLFALTNEKDAKLDHRQDFDSKLVLFCLAVSDIVIINVRGNLDLNTQRILRICYEKLEALNKSEETKPEIVIVLNQNSTSKTQESENEFKKIKKTLPFKIAKSLSMAYIIKNYNHKDISIFSENQILTKKTPLPHFKQQTTDLLKDIIACMKQKKTAEKIVDKIANFQAIWSTVLAFPNLSKMMTKQFSELETKIKTWKKIQDEEMRKVYKEIINSVKAQVCDENKAQKKLEELNDNYLENYKKEFDADKIGKQLTGLVENEEKEIHHQNVNRIMTLKYNLTQINLKKQLNREKFEGDFILREVENEIIREQNQGNKYTEEEKQAMFDKCFKKKLEKINKSMRLHEKCKSQEERIRNQYELLIRTNKSSLQSLGLIREKLTISEEKWIHSPSQQIAKLLEEKFCSPSKFEDFLEHTNRPHTNILKGSHSDAKLKYFNIKDYYKTSVKSYYKCIDRRNLAQYFKKEKFIEFFQKVRKDYKGISGQTQYVRQIYNDINKELEEKLKVELDFKNFQQVLEDQSKVLQFSKTEKLKFHSRKKNKFYAKNCTQVIEYFSKEKNPFFKIADPKQLFYWQHGGCYLTYGSTLEAMIQKSINWKKIKECWKQNKKLSLKHGKQRMESEENKQVLQQINKDLAYINCSLPTDILILEELKNYNKQMKSESQYNFFDQIFQNVGTILENTTITFTPKQFEEQSKNWNKLKYFNCRKIQQGVKQFHYEPSSEYIQIAKINEQYLEPTKAQFSKYHENNSIQLQNQFKSIQFKNFIFSELQKQSMISNFVKQIFMILQKSKEKWGRFESKAITEVYKMINSEITKFNDDLNQVSYQLSVKTMGKIHLIVIYMIWKYETDAILKNETEIYKKEQQSREKQLRKFLMRTSNDINEQIKQQVESFQDKILEFFNDRIEDCKAGLFYEKKSDFTSFYDRKQIQREIDMRIFQIDTDPQIVLQYLQKPVEEITKKYEQKYAQMWDLIKRTFYKESEHKILFQSLENVMKQFIENLTDIDKIGEENGMARDIFEMTGEASESDYDEEAKKILFQFFLDMLLDKDPNKERKCSDLTLKTRNSLARLPQLQEKVSDLLSKIYHQDLKMTNLPKFIQIFLSPFFLSKFQTKLNEIYYLTPEEKIKFTNDIRVVICSEKCPCCGRICGLEKGHTFHKCQYGHQMRALAGNYILRSDGKKQAYVVRCEQLEQTETMQYNGNKYTWTQFKDYWANKPVGGWHYDDTAKKLNDEDEKRFKNAWFKAGPIYCKKHGLQYVSYTDSSRQKSQTIDNVHFIFALDESGSMSGESWNQLMNVLEITLNKVSQHEKKGGNPYVTIINFNNSYRMIYQRVKPSNVNMSQITYGSGGTTFSPVFEKVAEITNQNINKQTIIFVFMTDGGAQYPSNGIKQFQNIMNNHPKKFIYSGIELGGHTSVMDNISMALGGKNIVAHNFDQLLQAYSTAIQIIAYKQEDSFKMMEEN